MALKVFVISVVWILLLGKSIDCQTYNAEVLHYKTTIEFDDSGIEQIDSITIQINNRAGETYAEIEIPYSKNTKVTHLSAWIETLDGKKVRDLKKSEIIDRSAISIGSFYADVYIKNFQLRHTIYPYKIVYKYTTSFKNFITIADWTPLKFKGIPTRYANLIVFIPNGVRFQNVSENISGGKIDTTVRGTLIEWEASNINPIESEIFTDYNSFIPRVIISPLNFNYGVEGSLQDWKSFGNWLYRLNLGLDVLPLNEQITLSDLLEGITDEKEKVRILYHYLQDNTRYVNVTIGIGGLKPYPAMYVSQNKYGDCKALTNYMQSLLSFAGIESFYTIIFAGEQPRNFNRNLVGQWFNHAILAVPLKNDTIWLENTNSDSPFGYMGIHTQNREALIVSGDNSKLIRIPALSGKDNLVSNKVEFILNMSGDAYADLKGLYKGKDFEKVNLIRTSYSEADKVSMIRDYLFLENFELLKWDIETPHRDSAWILLHANLILKKFLKPVGEEYYFNICPIEIPEFETTDSRALPVHLPFPIYIADTLIYNLPSDFELKNGGLPVSIGNKFGKYTRTLTIIDGKLNYNRRFELYSGTYSLEQYPEFYKFLKTIKDIDNQKIIIKPKIVELGT